MRSIARRLIQLVVVVLAVTFLASLLTEFLPGDPVTTIAPFATDAQREKIRHANGLDENVFVRYKDWASDFFRGNMGEDYAGAGLRGNPVYDRVKRALPKSLLLMLYAQILTLLVAIPLGVFTAYRAGTKSDQVPMAIAFGFVALPTFVLAAVLKLYLGLRWNWFDVARWSDLGFTGEKLKAHYRHVGLPVLALAAGQIAVYARLLRSDMVATLQEDFILMAKSKGISNRRVLWRHALRPSSLTLLTVAGLNVATLVSGALIVERIFNIQGIGGLIYQAVSGRQYIALQSEVAVVAIIYVLINVIVDVLYTILDPRIRSARI
jgi:peptide/nickel transport system permease protein